MKDDKHVLITGIQRSGTTFTGKIMSYSPDLVYLPEPFNPYYGMEGVDCHFPYVEYQDKQDKYSLLLKDIFSFRARYRKNYSRDNLIKKAGKYFLGSRANIRYRMTGIHKKSTTRFLIKDPDAAFLSEYMSLNHNCQVLVLIRHPCAVMASYRRLGWSFNFNDFLQSENLMKDHFSEFKYLFVESNKSLAMQVGLLWICVYKVLRTYSEQQNNWLTVLHEDLCINPIEIFEDIFKWANLSFLYKIRRVIIAKTNSKNPVKVHDNRLHSFKRNSKELISSWKKSISIEERKILKEITEPISSYYYDEDSWGL